MDKTANIKAPPARTAVPIIVHARMDGPAALMDACVALTLDSLGAAAIPRARVSDMMSGLSQAGFSLSYSKEPEGYIIIANKTDYLHGNKRVLRIEALQAKSIIRNVDCGPLGFGWGDQR